jgi:hypothetical protein
LPHPCPLNFRAPQNLAGCGIDKFQSAVLGHHDGFGGIIHQLAVFYLTLLQVLLRLLAFGDVAYRALAQPSVVIIHRRNGGYSRPELGAILPHHSQLIMLRPLSFEKLLEMPGVDLPIFSDNKVGHQPLEQTPSFDAQHGGRSEIGLQD